MKMNNMFSCVCVKFSATRWKLSVCLRVSMCARGLLISVMVLLSEKERKTERLVVPDDSVPCCLATALTMAHHQCSRMWAWPDR